MHLIKEKWNVLDASLNKNWKLLFVVIMIIHGLGLVGMLIFRGVGLDGDANEYIGLARNFLNQGIMVDDGGDPMVFRTPGYPFFIAVVYLLTGGSNLVIVLIQILMSLCMVYMIFRIISYYNDRATGILGIIFFSLDLIVYNLATCVLTDLPFAFLVVLALDLYVRYIEKRKEVYAYACALTLNIAVLLRPTIMYINIILVVVALVMLILKKVPWRICTVYLLLFVIAFGGWSLRNYYRLGEPVYTTIRDESVFRWYAPLLRAENEGISLEEAEKKLKDSVEYRYPDLYEMDKLDRVKAYKDVGSSYVSEHKGQYLMMNVEGLFKEMFAPGMALINSFNLPEILRLVLMGGCAFLLGILYLIYAVGFFTHVKKWKLIDWMILLCAMYFMAGTAVLGYSRYRMAFYPLCIIGAFLTWRDFERGENNG